MARAFGILFFFLLCWPLIGVADVPGTVFGVPSALLYVFGCWALLVAVLRAVSRMLGD